MDGTLVDSEKVWDVGLTELAQRYGGALSADARTRMVGTSMAESMSILHGDIGQPWRDPVASVAWLEERVKELFGAGLVWRPGAAALLGVDVRHCVAIEDSPTGVASALAAGAAVLAVPAEVDLSGIAGVTLVSSLVEIDVGFLGRLVGDR